MEFHSSFGTCFKVIALSIFLVSFSFSHANGDGTTPSSLPVVKPNKTSSFTRDSFPPDFIFATASAAYQYEGAANIDGRGPSLWDHVTHTYPEKIYDRSNGDVTQDFYHRYKEDIKLMKSYGLDAFRLSISWSRIVPTGKVSKGVNKKGIEFYNNVLNELISNGMKPFVTIFHADVPQALQEEYKGYASPQIVNDYVDYANVCFEEFGDKVKYWATYNEPFVYSKYWFEQNIIVGDLAKDPYLTAHHILVSHAKAVQLYRTKFKKTQNGEIGIVINTDWMVPYSNSKEDIQATQRAQDFRLGWFMDPLTNGEYPKIMQTIVGNRLPKFTVEEAAMLKDSCDYIGLNYYSGGYVQNTPTNSSEVKNVITDPHATQTPERGGVLIGKPTGAAGFYVYPEGLRHLLVYIKKTYYNPTIYITENGMPDSNKSPYEQLINDHQRVDFLHQHLLVVKDAIMMDHVNVKGYFVWSLLDNWEWNQGFTVRFGLTYIDYKNGLKRIPKLSAKWTSSSNETVPGVIPSEISSFSRHSFPSKFIFGTSSAAYQYEGATDTDGRGPCIWDYVTHNYPEKIMDGSNADITEDFYHRYKEDIKLMKSYGLDAFRLSISWSRIVPTGKVCEGVNQKGIDFYNNVLNELKSNKMKAFVTIFHADLPQALQDEYKGYASPQIVNDYLDYADICFKEFGHMVDHWATYNEPFVYSKFWFAKKIIVGDLATDPYLTAHHILLSHAKAVQLYRNRYKKTQKGEIGIVIDTDWMVPYSNSPEDILAAQRAQDFTLGWFMDPLTKGEYPKSMQRIVRRRLPTFIGDEPAMVKDSYDFIGLNYYTGTYVKNVPDESIKVVNVLTDPHALETFERNGVFIGAPTGSPGIYVYPEGLGHLLVYIKKTYFNPTIYITENGMPDSVKTPYGQLINDYQRIDYLRRHLIVLQEAIFRDHVNVKGYFVWSFMDTWEWASGFTDRFGLTYINYEHGLKRIPKLSAKWFTTFLRGYK